LVVATCLKRDNAGFGGRPQKVDARKRRAIRPGERLDLVSRRRGEGGLSSGTVHAIIP